MSELTLTVVRISFLVLLWVLVLIIVSGDARRPAAAAASPARPAAPTAVRGERPVGQAAAASRASAAVPRRSWSSPSGALAGTTVSLGSAADHDRSRARLHHRARRRLRLQPARPDLPAADGQWVVEDLGLHQRHLPGPAPSLTGPTPAADRRPGPYRQDRPRAAEVARHDARRCATPPAPTSAWSAPGQRGLRLRRAAPARRRRRHGRARRRRGRELRGRSPHSRRSTTTTRDGDLLDALRQRDHRGATSASATPSTPSPQLEGMGTTLTALLWAGSRIGLAHVGDSRAYLLRDGELDADHPRPHLRPDPRRRGPDHARGGGHHPQRSLLTRALGTARTPSRTSRSARSGSATGTCSAATASRRSSARTRSTRRSQSEPAAGRGRPARRARAARRRPRQHHRIVADVVDSVDPSAEPSGVPGRRSRWSRRRGPRALAAHPRRSRRRRAAPRRARAGHGTPSLDPEARARRRKILRRPVAACARRAWSLIGAFLAFDAWTRTQYFVGVHDGQVTIFRGIPQDVLGPQPRRHLRGPADRRHQPVPDPAAERRRHDPRLEPRARARDRRRAREHPVPGPRHRRLRRRRRGRRHGPAGSHPPCPPGAAPRPARPSAATTEVQP